MEEEDMEDVSLDETVVGARDETKEVDTKTKVMEAKTKEKVVNGNEDQVLAALGNIGRWQVQIIMITGQDIWPIREIRIIILGLEMRLLDWRI